MRPYSRTWAPLLALFAFVAIHAAGQGSGEALARATLADQTADSKHFVVPGRTQPGYRERDFRPQSAPARRDTQGGSPDKCAAIPIPATVAPEGRLVGAVLGATATAGPSATRKWNRARAPPLCA